MTLTRTITDLWNRAVIRPVAAAMGGMRGGIASIALAAQVTVMNRWRDLFNPLRALTMNRVVMWLEEGERGAFADIQWLYRFIEKRDATLRGGKRSLIGAVTEMEWDIKVVEEKRLPRGFTLAQAEAQAVELRTAYDAITNLTEAIEFLCLAEFRGYAHLEKINDGAGVVELRPVEQWYWCRNGQRGAWEYNENAASGRISGMPIDPANFIVREVPDPINEIAAIAFVRKQLSRKDWDGFIESFGIPSIFAIMPPNVPQGREAEYQDLAEKVISDSRGALPNGSDIKAVDPGARGTAPFEKHLDALDKEIVMAITSGALTMLAESGSGTLAGSAHTETFMRIARALARRVTQTLQQQFDRAVLTAKFPGQPPLAYFEILAEAETNVSEIINDAKVLKDAGFDVDAAQIEERTSYKVTRSAPVSSGPLPVGSVPNRAGGQRSGAADNGNAGALPSAPDAGDAFINAAADLLAQSSAADFAPIAAALEEAMRGDEAGLEQRLKALRDKLPDLLAAVADNDELVAAWEDILSPAALEGFTA